MRKSKPTTVFSVQAKSKRLAAALVVEKVITPAFLAKLEVVLATTLHLNAACAVLGLPYRTFAHWRKQGQRFHETLPAEQMSRRPILTSASRERQRPEDQRSPIVLRRLTPPARPRMRSPVADAPGRQKNKGPRRAG